MNQRVFYFRSYGSVVRFEAGDSELLELGRSIATRALVGNLEFIEIEESAPDVRFGIFRDESGALFFTFDDEVSGKNRELVHFSRTFTSVIRVKMAANARPWVFIHAGVVGWKGRAIIIPAQSRNGKTSLVSELIRAGAEYYSDDFAVFDEQGMVHPFARELSVRVPGKIVPVDTPAADFGAKTGTKPMPVGMVLVTRFVEKSDWQPEERSLGNGILESIPNVIAIANKPDSALKVLNTAFRRAIILVGSRGEAKIAASQILSFFDNSLLLGKIA